MTVLLVVSFLGVFTVFLMFLMQFYIGSTEKWDKLNFAAFPSGYFAVFMILLEPVIITNVLPLIGLSLNCRAGDARSDPDAFNSCDRSYAFLDICLSSFLLFFLLLAFILLYMTTENKNIFQKGTKRIAKSSITVLLVHKLLLSFIFLPSLKSNLDILGQLTNAICGVAYLAINHRIEERKSFLSEIFEFMLLVLYFNIGFNGFIGKVSSQSFSDFFTQMIVFSTMLFEFYLLFKAKYSLRKITIVSNITSKNIMFLLPKIRSLIKVSEMGSFEENFYIYNSLINTICKNEGVQEEALDRSLILPSYFYQEKTMKIKKAILNEYIVKVLYRYLLIVISKCERMTHCDPNPFYFLQIYFLCYKIQDFKSALWVLIKSVRHEKVQKSIFDSFEKIKIIYQLENHAEERSRDSLLSSSKTRMMTFLHFEIFRLKLNALLKKASDNAKLCFKELVLSNPNMQNLNEHFQKFNNDLIRAGRTFEQLENSEILPKSIFQLYTKFLLLVAHDKIRYFQIMQKNSYKIESKILAFTHYEPISYQIEISREQIFFIVSADPESFGTVKYVSQDVPSVFNTESSSIINHKFKDLKPRFIREEFRTLDKFLQNESLFQAFEKIPTFLDFYIDSNGNLMATASKLSLFRNISKGINLFVLSSPLKLEYEKNEGCLLIDCNSGLVLGHTKKFNKIFKISSHRNYIDSLKTEPNFYLHDFFQDLKDGKFKELLSGDSVTTTYDSNVENFATMREIPNDNSMHMPSDQIEYSINVIAASRNRLDKTVNNLNQKLLNPNLIKMASAKLLKSCFCGNFNVAIVRFGIKSLKTCVSVSSQIDKSVSEKEEIVQPKSFYDDFINRKPLYRFNNNKISMGLKLILIVFIMQMILAAGFAIYHVKSYQTEFMIMNNRFQQKDLIANEIGLISRILYQMQKILSLEGQNPDDSAVASLLTSSLQKMDSFMIDLRENSLNLNSISSEINSELNSYYRILLLGHESIYDLKSSTYSEEATDSFGEGSEFGISLFDYTYQFLQQAERFKSSPEENTIFSNKKLIEQFIGELQSQFSLDNRGNSSAIDPFFSRTILIEIIESCLFGLLFFLFTCLSVVVTNSTKRILYYFSCFEKRDLSTFLNNVIDFETRLEEGQKRREQELEISSFLENKGNIITQIDLEVDVGELENDDISDHTEEFGSFNRASFNSKSTFNRISDNGVINALPKNKLDMWKRYQNAKDQSLVSRSKLGIFIFIALLAIGSLQVGKVLLLQSIDTQLNEYKSHENLLSNIAYGYFRIEFLAIFNPMDPDCETCQTQIDNALLAFFQQYKNIKVVLDVTQTYGLESYYEQFNLINASFCEDDSIFDDSEINLKALCDANLTLLEGFEPVMFSVLQKYRTLMRSTATPDDSSLMLFNNPLGDVIATAFASLKSKLKEGTRTGFDMCRKKAYLYQIIIEVAIFILWSALFLIFFIVIKRGVRINEAACNILTNFEGSSAAQIIEELKENNLVVTKDGG
jgi:hypothetical protein